ncbi:MAG: CoA-binding protein [Candidatus ainarchaeum sp.]|jgi:hypothetical protein|nr:CoA-binding protein [Candidatus ainarchaeum sp.]MDD3085925.1 CoA-binding protein [Candidatus ainarchaeum sp.]MDD4128211.1 CoA-binding protein [Candidatus ainarchaeum sp.]MDD4467592.1 CoA-binding protein [Candidatus ainarchaeum sp.]
MDLNNKSFGIIGASNNPNKYGYKIVKALLKISPNIYPINPKESLILGQECFSDLKKISKKLDIIIFVTPPKITFEVLKKNFLRSNFFWFQPGSFDEEVINFCEQNGISYEEKKCIILESER